MNKITEEDSKKSFAISPTNILDVDNGIDFTFDGLGLCGNRHEKGAPDDEASDAKENPHKREEE